MITITLQLKNAAQLAFLSAALDRMNAEDAPAEQPVERFEEAIPLEEKPAKKRKAAEPAPTADTPAATATTESTATAESPSEAPARITLEDLRARLVQISQAGKTDAVRALLRDFGATSVSNVKPDQYSDLLAKAEAL